MFKSSNLNGVLLKSFFIPYLILHVIVNIYNILDIKGGFEISILSSSIVVGIITGKLLYKNNREIIKNSSHQKVYTLTSIILAILFPSIIILSHDFPSFFIYQLIKIDLFNLYAFVGVSISLLVTFFSAYTLTLKTEQKF
ncbi:hypothetical protein AN642_00255 [Epulopiscium sp. SCG-B10WGA-EpuloA2]|nr:hypothetical protein AN642_00255 [Epulopiscium sp. SCG-B10WGA-EpuloA2]